MENKVQVTENLALIINYREIVVKSNIPYTITVEFVEEESIEDLLDESMFGETFYRCDIKAERVSPVPFVSLECVKDEMKDLSELKKFYEFMGQNEKNLFEMAMFEGELKR